MHVLGASVAAAAAAYIGFQNADALEQEEEKVDWTNAVKGNYDNRIRFFSSPDKIFSTFATQQSESGEWFMTLDDFIHAVLPSDFRGKKETVKPENVPEFFKLADLDGDGLISYGEFIFFLTMLGIPQRHIRSAFIMFDRDDSGGLDREEFAQVLKIMRDRSPATSLARGFEDRKDADMVFNRFFHGEQQDRISFAEFESWLTSLHNAVRELEFARFDERNVGSIPMSYFGISLVGYAAPRAVPGYLKRCESLMGREGRVTKEEFLAFTAVLEHLEDIITVVQMFSASGYEMCQRDFNRAVKAVTGQSLSQTVLDTIFVVFDNDGDGHLDYDELMGVLSHRQGMNLEHSRDTGFLRLMRCCKDCFST